MNKVVDFLKLQSLEESFIVAGFDGIFNTVIRMDILETSFPEVEKYLVPQEFVFTSFWNHRNEKGKRISLVQSLIEHRCAGIGIMPGIYLNNKIDQEIIDLCNSHSFPVIYVSSNCRWSDIISDFSRLTNSDIQPEFDSNFIDILSIFSELHTGKNIKKFCYQLNQFLSLPIVINADNEYFNGLDDKIASTILSKIYVTKMQNVHSINTPVPLHIKNENFSFVYFGSNSVIATYIDIQNLNNPKLQIFHKIASIVTKELDNLCPSKKVKTRPKRVELNEDISYFLVFLKKDNISSVIQFIDKNYIFYEQNDFYNYIIFLIPNDSNNKDSIFSVYHKIIEKSNPILFIFSNQFSSTKELHSQIEILKQTISSLLFLNGIFSIDELPLLYMILFAPYEYKKTLFKMNSMNINLDIGTSFFDTLRLYLVLKNINDVSILMGIHSNSVKYRIQKCFEKFESDSSSALADLPSIKLLLALEILKVEGNII